MDGRTRRSYTLSHASGDKLVKPGKLTFVARETEHTRTEPT
jgi:hypothetical protein